MIKFEKVNLKNSAKAEKIFSACNYILADYSAVCAYMWKDFYDIKYAFFKNDAVQSMRYTKRDTALTLPVSENKTEIIKELATEFKTKKTPLEFCCVPDDELRVLYDIFPFVKTHFDRTWSDYVYLASDFASFSGKRFAGQRNHINKFKSLYPKYKYERITKDNIGLVKVCMDKYAKQTVKKSTLFHKENECAKKLIDEYFHFNLLGGMITVDGVCVAFSINELVGETLIVHVEKALKSYEGVGQVIVNEIAKDYGAKAYYINREDDSGDEGLRVSKLQYHPVEIMNKNFVRVYKTFYNVYDMPTLRGENVVVSNLTPKDKESYCRMYVDEKLNEYWGYDYRADIKKPCPESFYRMQRKDIKEKTCFSLKVTDKATGEFAGEVCLHNFDYFGNAEIGVRILPEYQRKGYAAESLKLLTAWAYKKGAKKVYAKCYKENLPSKTLLEKVFSFDRQDDTYYYFIANKP